MIAKKLSSCRRIVIKIGSALLVDDKSGILKSEWLAALAEDIAAFHALQHEIILVSSGSIALGRHRLGLGRRRLALEEKQAAAAVGQIALAQAWSEALGAHKIIAGQILVTLKDTEERRRYLNARATLETLLAQSVIPVINENDTVATSEIRYGDNDRLAARMASMMSADCLVLLSDIDGLYDAPPGRQGARLVPVITDITPEIEAMAGKSGSSLGTGGMITKIEAGKIALAAGTHMVIASGRRLHALKAIEDGTVCSWFLSSATPIQARKRWIAGTLVPQGRLYVDEGAVSALIQGKSLLPAGVVKLEGSFSLGDAVVIIGPDDIEIARGLVGYDHGEAKKISGLKTTEIEEKLGYIRGDELVHRNNLALLNKDRIER